jgi:hypothetical protein
MKKAIIIFCSSFFYISSQAADAIYVPNEAPQKNISQQSVDDTVAAFNQVPPARRYSILAQLADELPDDENKIKLGTRILKNSVTKVKKQTEDVMTLSYNKRLSTDSIHKLNEAFTVITTALNAQKKNTQSYSKST